jgi:hypothetical protein
LSEKSIYFSDILFKKCYNWFMSSRLPTTKSTKKQSLTSVIRQKICARGPGTVVNPADFLSLGSRAAVDQVLSRLTKEGTLRRLRRGVYHFPQINEHLGMVLSPTPEAIAQALARGHRSSLQIAGAQAANLLGLSEQVPAHVVYLTDGTAGKVQIGNQTIELRHAAPRSMQAAGRISGTVIQALRYLGQKNVTPEVLRRLQTKLSDEDKKTLQRDMLLAPGWMRPPLLSVIKDISLDAVFRED